MKRTAAVGERLEPLAVGPVAGDDHRRAGPRFAASISRSIRFARSSRPTERTKSPYSSQRYGSSCGGCGITSASSPVERRSRSATLREVAKTFRASPSATLSSSWTLRRIARSSGDSPNWPSAVRSSS